MGAVEAIDLGARAIALAGVALFGLVAATHWAVRRKALAPFGVWSRTIRSLSDPLLRPIESRLARRGGNPQDATFWLLGIAIIAGLLLINLSRWLTGLVLTLIRLGSAPPIVWARVAVDWVFGLLMLALIVRVVGGWLALSPYSRWMRLAHRLTDCRCTPTSRATSAWLQPLRSSSAARSRRASRASKSRRTPRGLPMSRSVPEMARNVTIFYESQ